MTDTSIHPSADAARDDEGRGRSPASPSARRGLPPLGELGLVRWPLRTLAAFVQRFWTPLAVLLFGTAIAACSAAALAVPILEWDLIAYMAVVFEDPALTNAELHAKAFGAMQAHANEREWHALRNAYLYYAQMWENADWFVSQLGMYRVKVGYTALLTALQPFMDLVTAAKVLNAVAAALIGIGTYLYMRAHRAEGALPIAACLMFMTNFFSMTIITSADVVASAPTLIGLLLLATGRIGLGGTVLVLGALLRTDNVIVLFAALLASLWFGEGRIKALASFVAGFVIVLVATSGLDHPGWWPHFYFSLVEQQVDMSNFNPPFDPKLYLYTLVEQVGASLHFGAWLPFTALMAMGWGLLANRGVAIPRTAQLALMTAFLAILGKFVVFPLPADRIYFSQNVAIAIILLAAARPTLSSRPRTA